MIITLNTITEAAEKYPKFVRNKRASIAKLIWENGSQMPSKATNIVVIQYCWLTILAKMLQFSWIIPPLLFTSPVVYMPGYLKTATGNLSSTFPWVLENGIIIYGPILLDDTHDIIDRPFQYNAISRDIYSILCPYKHIYLHYR